MSGKFYEAAPVQYWQDKTTARIFRSGFPEGEKPSPEWLAQCREVKLFHHGESDCVFVVDAKDTKEVERAWENQADEVDLETYTYWLTIYSNPEI